MKDIKFAEFSDLDKYMIDSFKLDHYGKIER